MTEITNAGPVPAPNEFESAPKVFVSYSWGAPQHQELVREWVDRLRSDGIDAVFDRYDLTEGNDKFAFMESMVTDSSVTHVLIFSDANYANKANGRQAGVGTESQIISQEVYGKVQQSKFIPIVCEFDAQSEPCLPVFLKSVMYIDFSTFEKANANWEQLIRVLYGKPALTKPELGSPPPYIVDDTAAPQTAAMAKFRTLQYAMLRADRAIKRYRRDFLDECVLYADTLRIRSQPDPEFSAHRILSDCSNMKVFRNHIVDWVLLETESASTPDFTESLLLLCEQLVELKSRPKEVTSWNPVWYDGMSVAIYETFLYIIAALLKNQAFTTIAEVLSNSFPRPECEQSGQMQFGRFSQLLGFSDALNAALGTEQRFSSPAAELIRRQADRPDVPFEALIEADLVIFLASRVPPREYWYPQTAAYVGFGKAPRIFGRATRHRDFAKLAEITGISKADELREVVGAGLTEDVRYWSQNAFAPNFWTLMNMDALDSID